MNVNSLEYKKNIKNTNNIYYMHYRRIVLNDFSGVNAVMDGKGFLKKVEEFHGVTVSTTKALMVSLMKKRFYRTIGKLKGQKKYLSNGRAIAFNISPKTACSLWYSLG